MPFSTIFVSSSLFAPAGLIIRFCLRQVSKSDRISLCLICNIKCFDYIQFLLVALNYSIHFLPTLADRTLLKHPSSNV